MKYFLYVIWFLGIGVLYNSPIFEGLVTNPILRIAVAAFLSIVGAFLLLGGKFSAKS
jgi:hypothetical protein